MSLPQYRIYSINLVPGVTETLSVAGNFIGCLASSERFNLSLNGQSPVVFQQGLSLPNIPEVVTQISLSSVAGAAFNPNVIEIAVGFGELRDSRFASSAPITLAAGVTLAPGQAVTVGAISIAAGQSIKNVSAATLDSVNPDVALSANVNTLIVAQNLSRRSVRVRNLSTTDVVRLASNAADLTAGRGYYLGASEDVSFEITGNVYARSTGTPTLNFSETVY